MNEATNRRITLARQIGPAYIQNSKVQALAVTGPVARGWADAYSALEIYVFWSETPSEVERQAIGGRLGGNSLMVQPHKDGRWADRGDLEGIKVELTQLLVETVEQCLVEVIEHHDADIDKQI